MLITNAESLLQLTVEQLIDRGYMEWQGDLKSTYNKYLLPANLNLTNQQMWDLICEGKILNLFQFETTTGSQCIKKLQPQSLVDLANANSLMRLSTPDKEQPLDKYVRFKANPLEWEQEMIEYGLNEEERKVMHEELDNQFGVCSNQESLMSLFMNPKVANLNIREANILRKGIGKKKAEIIEQAKQIIYKKGREIGTRKVLLDYCFIIQCGYQAGYAFALPHTTAYSLVGLQEGNIFVNYPSIYWYNSNLLSMSESIEGEDELDDEFVSSKDKATNYGKIAKAISTIQKEGVIINLPNINESQLGFTVREEDNSILFGLKGISGINERTVNHIINSRPYTSIQDFHNRLVEAKEQVVNNKGGISNQSLVTSSQVITLIKAGTFDELENKPRREILTNYLNFLFPPKKSLTMQNMDSLIKMGIVDEEHRKYVRFYNFRKFLIKLPNTKDEVNKNTKWYKIYGDEETIDYTKKFLEEFFLSDMDEGIGYRYDDEGYMEIAVGTTRKGSFDRCYNAYMDEFKAWMNTDECLDIYNDISFLNNARPHLEGNESSWEMDTLSMYYSKHELFNIDTEKYSIVDYNSLPKEPNIIGHNSYRGIEYPKYELSRIVGTVLDRNKNKHIVSILTPSGVINMKMYAGQFAFYDKAISYIDEDTGKKVTVEDSWFKKGTKLLITGYKIHDQFKPKTYKDGLLKHSIQRIISIENGNLNLQTERARVD